MPVSEGMLVRGCTEQVSEARQEVVEFLLTSHPLAMLASQSTQPALQLYWQAPAAQPVVVVLAGALVAQS